MSNTRSEPSTSGSESDSDSSDNDSIYEEWASNEPDALLARYLKRTFEYDGETWELTTWLARSRTISFFDMTEKAFVYRCRFLHAKDKSRTVSNFGVNNAVVKIRFQ